MTGEAEAAGVCRGVQEHMKARRRGSVSRNARKETRADATQIERTNGALFVHWARLFGLEARRKVQ